MASTQVTLVGGTVSRLTLGAPAGRVVVTQISGTPAVIYVTADGTDPVIPSSGVEVTGSQKALPALLAAQTVISPPLFGDHMAIPSIRLLSVGTPTVLVSW